MKDITVSQAATLLGWDVCFLRLGLQQGKYDFGVACKAPNAKRYAYKIYPKAFMEFMKNSIGKEM